MTILILMNRECNPQTISEKVIYLVADAKGVSPLALPPLGEQIDTGALNALFSSPPKTKLELRLEYEGVFVTIDEQGNVFREEDEPTTQ